jgi:hypothetical protein
MVRTNGLSGKLATMREQREKAKSQSQALDQSETGESPRHEPPVPEIGGPKGPEPTRFGDWERAGRCIDF